MEVVFILADLALRVLLAFKTAERAFLATGHPIVKVAFFTGEARTVLLAGPEIELLLWGWALHTSLK